MRAKVVSKYYNLGGKVSGPHKCEEGEGAMKRKCLPVKPESGR